MAPYPATSCSNETVNLDDVPLPYVAGADDYSFTASSGLAHRTRYDLIVAAQADPVLHAVAFTAQ